MANESTLEHCSDKVADLDPLLDIFHEIDNEVKETLKSVFLAKGRGRRPSLTKIVVEPTNEVLLQIFALKESSGSSWKSVEKWIKSLFPEYPSTKVRYLLESTVQATLKLRDHDARREFYSLKKDLSCIGEYCSKLNLTRSNVLDPTLLPEIWRCESPPKLTNGAVVELFDFCQKDGGGMDYFSVILCELVPHISITKDLKLLEKEVNNMWKKFVKLNKSKSRNGDAGGKFLGEQFQPGTMVVTCANKDRDSAAVSSTCDVPRVHVGDSETDGTSSVSGEVVIDSSCVPPQAGVTCRTDDNGNCDVLGIILKDSGGVGIEGGNVCTPPSPHNLNTELLFTINKLEQELEIGQLVSQAKIETLEAEIKTMVVKYKQDLKSVNKELASVQSKLKDIQSRKTYRKTKRREKYLNEKEKELEVKIKDFGTGKVVELKKKVVALEENIAELERKIVELEKKNSTLSKALSNQKLLVNFHKVRQQLLRKELKKIKSLFSLVESELLDLKLKGESVVTRNGNQFTENVEKCVMELSGELDVSSEKCGRIIQSVCYWLFEKDVPLSQLPCADTVTNMVDRAQVLSKMQVAEGMLGSERWNHHTDGTTRDHKKIMGQQIGLNSGEMLSAGFSPVAVEDQNTLLDNAIAMMEELADCCAEEGVEKETIYKSMIEKMFALMSDRASVNKAYNKKMNEYRKEKVGAETDLHFLYCNAHFLLGLSNACEQGLKEFEKELISEIGCKLGRDREAKFQRFMSSSESSAARFIRTGCDVLGPRGDEKNGCRMEWESYCEESLNVKSHVKSFRMNRFNNFFEGAAALYHHRQAIVNFMSDYKGNGNLKLQSVLYDARSEELMALVRALGIVYFKITGPFWRLLESDTEYVDLHTYVQAMLTCFRSWKEDPSDLLVEEHPGIFPDFAISGNEVSHSLYSEVGENLANITSRVLQQLMGSFVVVAERQLNDFIEGGVYGSVPTPELRAQMKHCRLTNLVSENEFGDLDFSQYRRRNASLHYHSGIQMIKQNRTISRWLKSKSTEVQSKVLAQARKKSRALRVKHRESEKLVLKKLKERLDEHYRKVQEKLAAQDALKKKLLQSVKSHGGPCASPSDVDNILVGCTNEKQKASVLKDEYRYLKSVLGISDKRLIMGKKKSDELKRDLQLILSQKVGSAVDENLVPEDVPQIDGIGNEFDHVENTDHAETRDSSSESDEIELVTPSSKKRKHVSEKSSQVSKSKQRKLTQDETQTVTETEFCFSKPGSWVAVAFEENFYFGEVTEVKTKSLATVQFLTKGYRGNFRWPRVSDICDIESEFVFAADFEVTKAGRAFDVPEVEYLQVLYNSFKEVHF